MFPALVPPQCTTQLNSKMPNSARRRPPGPGCQGAGTSLDACTQCLVMSRNVHWCHLAACLRAPVSSPLAKPACCRRTGLFGHYAKISLVAAVVHSGQSQYLKFLWVPQRAFPPMCPAKKKGLLTPSRPRRFICTAVGAMLDVLTTLLPPTS